MAYEVTIRETNLELTARERIRLKDTTDSIKLDERTRLGDVIITPKGYAILDVHNDKGDDKDYTQYLVIDNDDTKYLTGSNSFWSSFKAIFDEMVGETEEYQIKAYRVPSKNYKDKDFITCSIV